jgi:hypothetical protein
MGQQTFVKQIMATLCFLKKPALYLNLLSQILFEILLQILLLKIDSNTSE